MSFYGQMQNPSQMNGAFYQQLLASMQGAGGGVSGPAPASGGLPMQQNIAPQIALQQRQPQSNISPVPQQSQQQGQQGSGLGGAVQAGKNIQDLYGMGKNGYNNVSNMLNGAPPQAGPQGGAQPMANPMSSGAPVANSPAGNAYMANNPSMQIGAGGGMGTPGAAPGAAQGSQPFFGQQSMNMYGAPGSTGAMGNSAAAGTTANFSAPTSSMFGNMGATGAGAGTTYGSLAGGTAGGAAAGGTAAGSTLGGSAAASSTTPSWLSQLLDAL